MHENLALRFLFAAAGSFILSAVATSALAQQPLSGQRDFIVSHIEYALSKDASETGACPSGMTSGYANLGDVFVSKPDLQRKDGEIEDAYFRRAYGAAVRDPNVKNLCMNPELGSPDPRFETVTGKNVPVYGIDLDGQDSRVNTPAAPGTCAHDDFRGMSGERGIDNQFFRVVGCSKSFQSTGGSNTFEIEMLTGSWGILLTLKGVDNLQNDDHVEVGIYANADPIQLSAAREPLASATYTATQDPRFRAITHGRIVNGVLTTDPVDVRFHWVVNSMYLERPLKDARLRMTFTPDGAMGGILAGYTPVEEMYDLQFGFRNGKDANGNLSPYARRANSSIGRSRVAGETCQGVYYALQQLADGERDPATGKCMAISTQYHIKAIPAFVVEGSAKTSP